MQIEKAQMQTRGRNHSDLLSPMRPPSVGNWLRATVHVARERVLLLSSAKA
jgi:hypothetical protein